MELKFELLPDIENITERKIHLAKVRYLPPPGTVRNREFNRGSGYTVGELKTLLEGPHAIWGFDPRTGTTELLRRSALEWEVKKRPNRKGTIQFSFEGSPYNSLRLIPSYTRFVPLHPQW